MPKQLERKLKAQAKRKGLGKKRTGAYVYGTLRKTGWKPSRENSKSDRQLRHEVAKARASA